MSTFSDSEPANASPTANHASPTNDHEQSRSQSAWPSDDENSEQEPPALEMTRCPECGARHFISKLLVYEVTSYDEGGEREFRRQHVRAEFEFTCGECQSTLRTLPVDRRDYYEEVHVLAAERRAALWNHGHQLCRRLWRRLWAAKVRLMLVLTVLGVVILLGL